jgi:glycine/D-amino acid oxidase-like deaminating enzyme
MEADEVRESTGGHGFVGGYRLADTGALNPAGTARLLARGAVAAGARVVEDTGVTAIERAPNGLVCHTERGGVRCDRVVFAVHTEGRRFAQLLGNAVVPIRGQALAAEIVEGTVPAGAWSTHWKMNVWRRSPAGRLHLSGWRHDAWDRAYRKSDPEVDPEMQEGLLAWFRQAFPDVRLRVTSRWSGVFGWTTDFLPIVGPVPGSSHEFVISGFSGGGLPFAFECGRMVADLVRGEDPGPAAGMFDPGRFVR